MNLSGTDYQPYLESLDKLGFCTFQVFNNGEIDKLRSLYQDNFGTKDIKELYATHNSNPADQSLFINREIKKIVNERLQNIFPDYDYFIGHFMVKGAQVNKEFALHQDWNIVDEAKYKSYQVWIPLQLAYPANGGIFVVPGSHRFFGNYRSGSYGIPFIPFDDRVEPIVTDIIVPPGNALVYHNALFHASHPNITDDIRIAVIVNYVEKNSPTSYFHRNIATGSTELYAIDGETLISHLPSLERGIIDESIKLRSSTTVCPVQNNAITSKDLAMQYQNNVGKKNAAQIKQLHVTVDVALEDELNQEGYTVINLLDTTAIDVFKQEYNAHFGNLDRIPGRFTTLQHTDAVLKKYIHDFIVKHVDAPLKKFFKDFIIPVSQFYTKKAFTSGDIDLHADSTLLLNHQLEPHYAIWVPLIDVHSNNGTLTVIPKSHKVRGAFFSSSIGGYHHQHSEWLKQLEVPLTLKAGQAVVFDNNLLHNSTANNTSIDRLCFTFRLTHFASQYYSFICGNQAKNSFDTYEENHDYYMSESWDGNSKHSTGKYVGTFENSIPVLQKGELEKTLRGILNLVP